MPEFWECELRLTEVLLERASRWHSAHFPKCRVTPKYNNMCNHYRWFFDGCRCVGLIASENEARYLLSLTEEIEGGEDARRT